MSSPQTKANPEAQIDPATREKLEAAAFRRIVDHLRERKDVQNIDLMNLANFCRNCLAKWYAAAAAEEGIELDTAASRAIIYGMPYAEWKEKYQTEATPEQLAKWEAGKAQRHD